MGVKTTDQILALLKEGLGLWKTFIATREEAYNRKKDKYQERAIQAGEQGINLLCSVFTYLYFKEIDDEKIRGWKKQYLAIKKRFDRYD